MFAPGNSKHRRKEHKQNRNTPLDCYRPIVVFCIYHISLSIPVLLFLSSPITGGYISSSNNCTLVTFNISPGYISKISPENVIEMVSPTSKSDGEISVPLHV